MRQEPPRARAGFKRRLSSRRWDECDSDFSFFSGLSARRRRLLMKSVRTGAAAFGDWRTDAPGARRLITPADLAGAVCDALDSEHVAARSADRRRHSKGAARLHGRSVRHRAQHAARHSRRAERRHLRGGNRSGPGARLSPGQPAPDRRKARSSPHGLQRPYGIAFYPSGSDPKFVYVASPELRCALSLSQRRHEGLRPRGKGRKLAERWRTLDPRPRVLA